MAPRVNKTSLSSSATLAQTQPTVRRKRWLWRWCTQSVLCFTISIFSLLCSDQNIGWVATAFQGTLSSRISNSPRISSPANFASPKRGQKAAVLSHGQRPQQQKRTAATPLFDTERTEAEMKLSAQLGPGEEISENVTLVVTDMGTVEDVPRPTELGGYSHTNASKAKISAANKGRTPWNKGQARPADVRQRIAEGVRAKNRERFLQKLESLNMSEEEYERQKKDERNKKAAERRARQTEKGGFRPTDETRQKISEILKAKWANGEMPRRRLDPSKVRSGFSHSPETRAKISAALRKKWDSDAGYRESMMNKTTVINARGDMRQKISETLKAKWLEPDFREKMMEKIRNRRAASKNRDDDYRRKISEAMKAKWQDDDYRNKTTSSIRQRTSVVAKARPEKQQKKPKKPPRVNPESKVRLAQVVGPAKTVEATKRSPREVDEDGEPIVKTKVKKVRKVKKVAVKLAVPLTSNGNVGSADDGPVKKKTETAKKVKEPDGSITRLRDERRDLYDLLYGDDEDSDSVESPPANGISAMLDLEDANLDTYDPYGLEDF